jgi:hypothetical protein
MTRKFYSAIVPLLAIAAFALVPTVAQAVPHWYKCEAKAGGEYHDPGCTEKTGGEFELRRLPFTSAKTRVSTWGVLTIHNEHIGDIQCYLEQGTGKIWNTTLTVSGKGESQIRSLGECESTTAPCTSGWAITSEGLPWPTELLAGPPIRVKVGTAATPIKIRYVCQSLAVYEVFYGELTPKWVNNSPSYMEFDTPGSGHLESTIVGTGPMTFTGKIYVSGTENGENILALNP